MTAGELREALARPDPSHLQPMGSPTPTVVFQRNAKGGLEDHPEECDCGPCRRARAFDANPFTVGEPVEAPEYARPGKVAIVRGYEESGRVLISWTDRPDVPVNYWPCHLQRPRSERNPVIVTIKGVRHHFWRDEAEAALHELEKALRTPTTTPLKEWRGPTRTAFGNPMPGYEEYERRRNESCAEAEMESLAKYILNWLTTRNGGSLGEPLAREDQELFLGELTRILVFGGHPPNWVPEEDSSLHQKNMKTAAEEAQALADSTGNPVTGEVVTGGARGVVRAEPRVRRCNKGTVGCPARHESGRSPCMPPPNTSSGGPGGPSAVPQGRERSTHATGVTATAPAGGPEEAGTTSKPVTCWLCDYMMNLGHKCDWHREKKEKEEEKPKRGIVTLGDVRDAEAWAAVHVGGHEKGDPIINPLSQLVADSREKGRPTESDLRYVDSLRKKADDMRGAWEHSVLVRGDLERKLQQEKNRVGQQGLGLTNLANHLNNARAALKKITEQMKVPGCSMAELRRTALDALEETEPVHDKW